MKNLYSTIYKGFIISAVISFIIGFFSNGSVSVDAYIAGYSVLILGIMMLLTLLFNNILKSTQGLTTFQILSTIFLSTGPFLLMLGVIGFILYLMIIYKNSIIENHVSNVYYSFSSIIVILLFIQLYLVSSAEEIFKIPKITSYILYLLGILSVISSIIIYTILKYFKTDGFTNYLF